MSETVRFETPEHVAVDYALAGLGTRFVAWVYDMLVIFVAELVLLFFIVIVALAGFRLNPFDPQSSEFPSFGAMGLLIVVLGFLPLAYFALFEHFMNGQTLGKRSARIRVVAAEGFSLTFTAILLRSLFRVIDTIPLFWAVPFLTRNGQRFGDMVAGTIVIQERPSGIDALQARLMRRDPAAATFRFTTAQLNLLTEDELRTLERFLERQTAIAPEEAAALADRLAGAFATRMNCNPFPDPTQRVLFLEDLFAAYLHRQIGGLK